jgi:hypothetical protein
MDPNATLKMIDDYLQARRADEDVDEWVENLRLWLAGGGFAPRWADYPLGTAYYHALMVQRAKTIRREVCTVSPDTKIIVEEIGGKDLQWLVYPEDEPQRTYFGRTHEEALGQFVYLTNLLGDRVVYQHRNPNPPQVPTLKSKPLANDNDRAKAFPEDWHRPR